VKRFRGGLVFKAHRRCVSLDTRRESNKEEKEYEGFWELLDEDVYGGIPYTLIPEPCSPNPEPEALNPEV